MSNQYFFLIFLSYNILLTNAIIVFPFLLSRPKDYDLPDDYSPQNYFSDNIEIDFHSSINLGKENLRILARISTNTHTFSLSETECDRKSVNNIQDYGISTRNVFQLYQSTSYKNISKFNNFLTNFKDGGIISENFKLYNTSKLKCQPMSYSDRSDKEIDSRINVTNMKIIVENFGGNKLCANLGIGAQYTNTSDGIHFINELKRINAINDYTYTFKYITSSDGQIIIGGLPHDYDNKTDNYKSYQYVKTNSPSFNDINFPWSISFDKISVDKNKDNVLDVQNNGQGYLLPHLGYIIGTQKYKKLIFENFFQTLIDKNICKINKVKNINDNIFWNKFKNFEIISCDSFSDNDKIKFPRLNFTQIKDLDYIFFFTFYHLFENIQDKYYFSIIFPEEDNDKWYLGRPFLSRYQFFYNYDSKTIGFYNEKIKKDKQSPTDKTTDKKEEEEEEDNKDSSNTRLFIEIGVITLLCLLIIAAFVIGKKINDKRKQRANELSDENFEYLSKNNKEEDDEKLGV